MSVGSASTGTRRSGYAAPVGICRAGRDVPAHQLVKIASEDVAQPHELVHLRVRARGLPFRDRLPAYPHEHRELLLRHVPLRPQSIEVVRKAHGTLLSDRPNLPPSWMRRRGCATTFRLRFGCAKELHGTGAACTWEKSDRHYFPKCGQPPCHEKPPGRRRAGPGGAV